MTAYKVLGNYPTGGRVFGGGGLFIPIRYVSPVAFRFQPILKFNGCSKRLAPGTGQSPTQQPHIQHASGYITIGGWPFSGLGTSTVPGQLSTQVLQPLQRFELKISTEFGVMGPGSKKALLYMIVSPQHN